jgi:DNA-binding IclR family transcriptional regulator
VSPVNGSDPGRPRGAKTLDNGLRVLAAVAARPDGSSVSDLARIVGLHRTIVYRLLLTLIDHALVSQDPSGHRYRLGSAAAALGIAVRGDLQRVARPYLSRLAEQTGATAHLTVLDGADAVSIAVVEPSQAQMHVAYRVGSRHPLSRGAAGLAILVGGPPRRGERAAVRAGRHRGYVATAGEIQPGAWGLAAPITVVGPAEASVGVISLGPLSERRTAAAVQAAAAAISAGLGQPSGSDA